MTQSIQAIANGGPMIPEEDIDKILQDLAKILRSGQLTQGEYLERFEADFATMVGTRYAIGMTSGTAPLEVALRHFGVEDREVIVPTNTFAASVSAILLAGGRPVLADIDPLTLGSGVDQIEPLITDRTRAVLAVHVAGMIDPAFDDLVTLCHPRGLMLLEDAAHAHGAMIQSGHAGGLGDSGAFSFYPTKVITCGEGGMLTTNDPELADFARSWRSHGQATQSRSIIRVGHNYRLPEMSAALGWHQLQRLDDFVEKRQHLAGRYQQRLAHLDETRLVMAAAPQRHPYYKLPLVLPESRTRTTVGMQLKRDYGISTGSIYWPPCHLQPAFEALCEGRRFPVAEGILDRTIALPMHGRLTEAEVDVVCDALIDILEGGP